MNDSDENEAPNLLSELPLFIKQPDTLSSFNYKLLVPNTLVYSTLYYVLTALSLSGNIHIHFLGLKQSLMPYFALITSIEILSAGWSSSTDSSKCCSTLATTTLISCMAKFCPTQFLGPAENGMNAWESIFCVLSGWKRSGLKSLWSSPHSVGLWWRLVLCPCSIFVL